MLAKDRLVEVTRRRARAASASKQTDCQRPKLSTVPSRPPPSLELYHGVCPQQRCLSGSAEKGEVKDLLFRSLPLTGFSGWPSFDLLDLLVLPSHT